MVDRLPMVRAFLSRQRREAAAAATRAAALRVRADDVAAVLRSEFGATEVILFGSLVEGDVHAGSDVDLAVRGIPPGRYFEALARAADLLGCDVDLVELETARPALLSRIQETGLVLAHE